MLTFDHTAREKAELLAAWKEHREAGRLKFQQFPGNGDFPDESEWAEATGVDRRVAEAFLVVFEGLPAAEAEAWPEKFLESVPEGVDLSVPWFRFMERMLREIALPAAGPEGSACSAAVLRVADGYAARWVAGGIREAAVEAEKQAASEADRLNEDLAAGWCGAIAAAEAARDAAWAASPDDEEYEGFLSQAMEAAADASELGGLTKTASIAYSRMAEILLEEITKT